MLGRCGVFFNCLLPVISHIHLIADLGQHDFGELLVDYVVLNQKDVYPVFLCLGECVARDKRLLLFIPGSFWKLTKHRGQAIKELRALDRLCKVAGKTDILHPGGIASLANGGEHD